MSPASKAGGVSLNAKVTGLRSCFHLARVSSSINKILILSALDLCHSAGLLPTCMVIDTPALVCDPHFSLPLCHSLFPLSISLIFFLNLAPFSSFFLFLLSPLIASHLFGAPPWLARSWLLTPPFVAKCALPPLKLSSLFLRPPAPPPAASG